MLWNKAECLETCTYGLRAARMDPHLKAVDSLFQETILTVYFSQLPCSQHPRGGGKTELIRDDK